MKQSERNTRRLWKRFLNDHPEQRENVAIKRVGGEKLLVANIDALRVFAAWCKSKGLGRPDVTDVAERLINATHRHFRYEDN